MYSFLAASNLSSSRFLITFTAYSSLDSLWMHLLTTAEHPYIQKYKEILRIPLLKFFPLGRPFENHSHRAFPFDFVIPQWSFLSKLHLICEAVFLETCIDLCWDALKNKMRYLPFKLFLKTSVLSLKLSHFFLVS